MTYISKHHGHKVKPQKGRPRWDRYEAYHPYVNPKNSFNAYDCGWIRPISTAEYQLRAGEFQRVYEWVEKVKEVLRADLSV